MLNHAVYPINIALYTYLVFQRIVLKEVGL